MRIWTQEEINDVMARRENKETLQQIGNIYGVSRERIRQVQAKEIRKIKWRNDYKVGDKVADWGVRALEVSPRTRHCLEYGLEAKTIGDVLKYTRAELLREPNFGIESLKELENELGKFELSLKQ